MSGENKFPPEKNFPAGYVPAKVWAWDRDAVIPFGANNRPTAGARHDTALKVGKHPLQLYSMGSPNGVKVATLLEELLSAGHKDAEYDAWMINIMDGDQFGSGFTEINPNGKIPALVDHAPKGGGEPARVFESGSILLYLADKFGAFIPQDLQGRTETLNWLFWQVGSAPFLGGAFGHFYTYAPQKIQYAIDRYAMETKRLFDVLDKRLADREFVAGSAYTIADMALLPWFGRIAAGETFDDAASFLELDKYVHVQRWRKQLAARPAVRRGKMVNNPWGDPSTQLHERHEASDFETGTQDKIGTGL
jgi:GSH-dependent disulfide-bond oxidoreductase